ncbi:MAG: hypothetical protein HQL99_10540 [Magnetococcales bacterium]|nr:hypothetical protein [Magnetococcales bacterium]
MKHLLLLLALLTLITASASARAGEFIVPHQPGDTVILHVRPDRYAHPSDYWWQKDPSSQGTWSYFTPVDHLYQPIKLEASATGNRAGAIPVTNNPLR